ncbi:uncharacterized protein LOC116346630 [Contarinia nasturtii]|uniref:uncharacterized protein LOC116346630 n=1 Tax=Contarinia nasturtii TaxID=265458 RepID=UPI0012D4BBBB|nr:uncharacterized protein LOC116346630 [Contarinia nasturtii]
MYNNSSKILNIGATVAQDNSIIKNEFYTYTPYTNSFNESEEIRIAIQNQDSCLLPCDSYLYMQVTVKTENNDDASADKVKFVHNFPSFLFSDARYELNGVEIDRIRNVGITSTLKLSAASCPSNTLGYYHFNKAFSDKVAQSRYSTLVYDVMIPLKIWFGFCDDYKKLILNSRHELILTRARNSMNCVWGGKTDAGSTDVKIEVSKLEWKMPYITLADRVKMDMNKFLVKNKRFAIQHRSWDLYEYPELPQTMNHVWSVKAVSHLNKPRYVLVAFQHDKKDNKIADASKFNSLKINSVRLHLNSQVYPYHMHEFDIGAGRFSELYEAYANIQSSYYNGAENRNQFAIDFAKFQTNGMFAFDVSRSDESVKNGAVDIRLEIKASENIPAKCTAYCLIIYDNEFVYSPLDGIVERSV